MQPRPPLTPRRSHTAPADVVATPDSPRRNVQLPSERPGSQTKGSRPASTVSGTSLQVNPLQAEIERLTAACEEHERKIRTTKLSIEHRLYNEIPHILAKLNDVDDQAEVLTSDVQTSVQAAREPLRDKLASVVSAREKDVATMRARTTPWKSFFQDEDESNVLGSGKIARVPGAGLGGEDSDGLARIERWVEDVDIYLNSEIIRLKAALSSKSRRKTVMGGIISIILSVVLLLIAIGVASRRWG